MTSNAHRPTGNCFSYDEILKSTIISTAGAYAKGIATKTITEEQKTKYLQRIFDLAQKYKERKNGG